MEIRKQLVERQDDTLTFKKKCDLLKVSRASMYYQAKPQENDDVIIMNELREIYESKPMYGYRKMTVALRERGFIVNHKKAYKLLKLAGIQAIYPQRITTIRNTAHSVFPYLLRHLAIVRPNQVWQVDITYIKCGNGFMYLVCLIDVFSRKIMGYVLSNTLNTTSCLDALENALKYGIPEIINSDQGCQFTSEDWVNRVKELGIQISMDGKGRWADNVYIERLWRTIKYECVFLHELKTPDQLRIAIIRFVIFYNSERYHQRLNYHTPDFVFEYKIIPTKKELFQRFIAQKLATSEIAMNI